MDYFKAAQVSAAGMLAQKTRIEAATANIANMHTSAASPADAYRPVTAVITPATSTFTQAMEPGTRLPPPVRVDIVSQNVVSPRLAYEPGHPHADATGMVAYPAVDHAGEMMTVLTALRAYEANLAALQATKTLAAKALEIGGQ